MSLGIIANKMAKKNFHSFPKLITWRRYAVLAALAVICAAAWFAAEVYVYPLNDERLSWPQRFMLRQVNSHWTKYLNSLLPDKTKVASLDSIMEALYPWERRFADRIFAIDPVHLGFKGQFFTRSTASDLTRISAVKLPEPPDGIYDTGVNFLPRPIFDDYQKLSAALQKELGKALYIDSAYRSPGFQATLYAYYLEKENGYSLRENAKWIAAPGYSEHGSLNTAIDFINQDGISGEGKGQKPEDFERLPEFAWLQKNAARYHFYLSYPRGNPSGVEYEPWHWHWEKE